MLICTKRSMFLKYRIMLQEADILTENLLSWFCRLHGQDNKFSIFDRMQIF